jgi:hypothetical protein
METISKFESSKFKAGQSGNPAGKPKGILCGRMKALGALDRITGKAENIEIIEAALEESLKKKPLWFFVNIIMPLLPKETKGVLEGSDRVIEWRGLVTVGSPNDGEPKPVVVCDVEG